MPSSYASEVGRFRSRDADVEAAVAPADDGTRRTAWRGVAARVTRISWCAQCDTKRATAPERKKRTFSASRKGKRRAAAVRATACGAGVRHRGRRTRDRGACQRGGTRARSAMSALSALEKRLTALVPTTWTDASAPPDQRSLFELLAETAATTLRSSSAEVKEAQRSLEDVMLRVTCGGWAGPAVRVTAANVLANLFFVGNEVALYSCVNELVAVAFADDDKKAKNGLSIARASKENVTLVAGYLSRRAAKRIGALDALTRLANKGHADAMRGAAGGVVAAAERLLRRAPERAAAADGSAKGARAVRRAALRCVGAIVSSASESGNAGNDTRRSARPLRPETRVAAAKLLLAAVKFDAPSREFLNGASNLSAQQKNAQKLADAGAVAAACVALGKLATSPGGFDMWTDPAETPHGGPSATVGDAVAPASADATVGTVAFTGGAMLAPASTDGAGSPRNSQSYSVFVVLRRSIENGTISSRYVRIISASSHWPISTISSSGTPLRFISVAIAIRSDLLEICAISDSGIRSSPRRRFAVRSACLMRFVTPRESAHACTA